ncbi:MAG: hypothetical protein H6710_09665 [Myxococcales bacterium]|nr:hypothetical protein [Myxococcales bacterium]
MSAHRLGDDPPTALAPKAAALDLLARAGLPIPAGVVVDLGAPLDDAAWATIAAHVGDTPAIVRSALALEDRPEQSGAGLSAARSPAAAAARRSPRPSSSSARPPARPGSARSGGAASSTRLVIRRSSSASSTATR